jgi:hypothetical protein
MAIFPKDLASLARKRAALWPIGHTLIAELSIDTASGDV